MLTLFAGLIFGVCGCLTVQLFIFYLLFIRPDSPTSVPNLFSNLRQTETFMRSMDLETLKRRRGELSLAVGNFLQTLGSFSEKETCVWLNAVNHRLYVQMYNSGFLDHKFLEIIREEIAEFSMSHLSSLFRISNLNLSSYQIPNSPPNLRDISCHRRTNEHSNFVRFRSF